VIFSGHVALVLRRARRLCGILTVDLDGRDDANRAYGNRPQIGANTNIDATRVWLARFADTSTTYDARCRARARQKGFRKHCKPVTPEQRGMSGDCGPLRAGFRTLAAAYGRLPHGQ
jgi:hypothetical protein